MDREVKNYIDDKFYELKKQINILLNQENKYTTSRSEHSEEEIKNTNNSVEETQIGLTEAYEYTDGAYSELTDLQLAVVELYEIIGGE